MATAVAVLNTPIGEATTKQSQQRPLMVRRKLAQSAQAARERTKGLNRKTLAAQMNVPESFIEALETGSCRANSLTVGMLNSFAGNTNAKVSIVMKNQISYSTGTPIGLLIREGADIVFNPIVADA